MANLVIGKRCLFSTKIHKLRAELSGWEFFTFGLTLTLPIFINHISIIAIVTKFVYFSIKRREIILPWRTSFLVLIPAYFMLCAISILYSSDYKDGVHELEKLTHFIIIPLSFSIVQYFDIRKVVEKLATGLLIGNLIVGVQFVIKYLFFDWDGNSGDNVLHSIAPLHPTYLSFFFALGIILSGTSIFKKGWVIAAKGFLIVFFSICIILLASKLGIFFLLVSLSYIAYLIVKKLTTLLGIVFIVVVIGSLTFVAISSEVLVERFVRVLTLNFERHPVEGYNTLSGRIFFWNCAVEISQNHYMLGVGIGDAQHELDQCYSAKEPDTITPEFLDSYNVHNQFLQSLLEMGIPGLGLLLALFCTIVVKSWRKKELIPALISLMFVAFFLFESVLARNKGIILFSSFGSMVYFWFNRYEK